MKLKDWLNKNRKIFNESDLRFLIKGVFHKDLSDIAIKDSYIDSQRLQYLDDVTELAQEGVPLSYILGKEIFYGLEFKVDKEVLIPRPETELSVEKALDIISNNDITSVLDLGCGCGNIAVSVGKLADKNVKITASDVSGKALTVAQENAQNHNVDVEFIESDLFEKFDGRRFDLIVSNPPYVEEVNIKGSLLYEPHIALSGRKNGFYFIDKILKEAKDYLTDNGWLIIEMGYKHKELTEKLSEELDSYASPEWIKDYSGHFRAVVLRRRPTKVHSTR